MSKVHFASAKMTAMRADASLPAKFRRLLDCYPLKSMFEGKTVAIKMHLGGHLGYTTIPPVFVRTLVSQIKEAGGKPFITDGAGAVPGAKARGYTEEVLGCRLVDAAGYNEGYYVEAPVGYRGLETVQLCGEVVNADAMIVYSHGKGHGTSGWGGAIKNIGMGNVTCKSRGDIHALEDPEFAWDGELCTHCYLCRDNCPTNALSFNDAGELKLFLHHCRYCMHCVTSCPQQAITVNDQGSSIFQEGMARVNKACLDRFEPERVLYINHVCNVTPLCDCWGFSTPAIVPDVGVLASDDIVAVEKASIDMVKTENYIPGTLPPPLEVRDVPGHLFQKIHGKDPYVQCEEAERLGLGSQIYEIVEVQ